MIYEMRVYRVLPGRMPAMLARFEKTTLALFDRHGIRQAGFFTTLVGDLVQLSREDAVQPHPEPIDLRDVVNSALARVKRRGGPGIGWDVRIENGLYLLGEPDALERAVTNLLDNAVKFSPPDGHRLRDG